jgi:hypothetical protein
MMLWRYLVEVFSRFKLLLGGGSGLVVLAGVIEHFTTKGVTWPIYAWIIVACLVTALGSHGLSQYRRLQPGIAIRNLERRVWPVNQHNFTGAEYYFEVFNLSEAQSLEGVRVELVSMQPDRIGYLPVPLHIKHDSYENREFSVNPKSGRQIDLITGPTSHDRSQKVMVVAHTVNADRMAIPNETYHLTVRVSAKDIPPAFASFQAWVEGDELRCIAL